MPSLFGLYYLMISVIFHCDDIFKLDLSALREDLVQHLVRKLIAAHLQRTGKVLYLGRMGDLAAESVLLDHERAFPVSQSVKCSCHAGSAAAYYDDVIHFISLLYIFSYPVMQNNAAR